LTRASTFRVGLGVSGTAIVSGSIVCLSITLVDVSRVDLLFVVR
jgi:hypothetical protein